MASSITDAELAKLNLKLAKFHGDLPRTWRCTKNSAGTMSSFSLTSSPMRTMGWPQSQVVFSGSWWCSTREVIKDLLAAGATVTAYDPVAMTEARHCFPEELRLTYADNQVAALENADALIIVTEWKEFRCPDFGTIKAALKYPVIFDGRNLDAPPEAGARHGL